MVDNISHISDTKMFILASTIEMVPIDARAGQKFAIPADEL